MKTKKPTDPKSETLAELLKERFGLPQMNQPITLTSCEECGAHRYTGVAAGLSVDADLEPFSSASEEMEAREEGRYTFSLRSYSGSVYLANRTTADITEHPAGEYLALGDHRCGSAQARTMPQRSAS